MAVEEISASLAAVTMGAATETIELEVGEAVFKTSASDPRGGEGRGGARGPRRGDEGLRRGDEGSRRGDEGSRRGDEGSRRRGVRGGSADRVQNSQVSTLLRHHDSFFGALARNRGDATRLFVDRDPTYFRRADISQTGRGDDAAATWIFRGGGSRRRRRGHFVEIDARSGTFDTS